MCNHSVRMAFAYVPVEENYPLKRQKGESPAEGFCPEKILRGIGRFSP